LKKQEKRKSRPWGSEEGILFQEKEASFGNQNKDQQKTREKRQRDE